MPDTDIVITEIMYDAVNTVNDNNHEWVEVTNTGNGSVALDGWALDDSRTTNSGEGTFADITLAAGDIAIFYNDNITEAEFIALYNPAAGTVLIPVSNWQPLNNSGGDSVQLINASGDVIENIAYTDDASPGESLNYSIDGTYEGAGVPDPGIVCFTAGSLIATKHGERPIESLKVGEWVHTRDHGLQQLRWIGQRVVSRAEQVQSPEFRPVHIQKCALGPNQPVRDTTLSQHHRILLEHHTAETLFDTPAALCAAVSLVNGRSIVVQPPLAPVTYIHLLFDQHEVLCVDGLPSESFYPNDAGLDKLSARARKEVIALFPELAYGEPTPLAYPSLNAAEAALLIA